MLSKIKTVQDDTSSVVLTALGAWVMALATLVGSMQEPRAGRQPVVMNSVRPAYAYVGSGLEPLNRNDNENETVHMPTMFDVGKHTAAISGKK